MQVRLLVTLFFGLILNGPAAAKWTSRWSSNEYSFEKKVVPDMILDYGNGSTDAVKLKFHSAIEGYEDECNFIGEMRSDKTLNAVVNGCPDGPRYVFMVNTRTHTFEHWNVKNALYNATTRSIKDYEDEEENLDFNWGNDMTIDKFISKRKDGQKLSHTILKPQKDEEPLLQETPLVSQLDRNLNWTSFKHKIPEELFMRLAVGIDKGVVTHLKNDTGRISRRFAELLSHFQFIFHHKTFGSKVTFDTPFPLIDLSNYWDCGFGELASCYGRLAGAVNSYPDFYKITGNAQHVAGVGMTLNNWLYGVSIMWKTCSRPTPWHIYYNGRGSMTKYVPWNHFFSGRVIAHELAHNIGIGHVPPMDYCGGSKMFMARASMYHGWSPCNKFKFLGAYDWHTEHMGTYCMDRENPAKTRGSWTNWYNWACYRHDCKDRRVRECVGYDCKGEAVETRRCYYWHWCGSPPCKAK